MLILSELDEIPNKNRVYYYRHRLYVPQTCLWGLAVIHRLNQEPVKTLAATVGSYKLKAAPCKAAKSLNSTTLHSFKSKPLEITTCLIVQIERVQLLSF